MLVTLKVIKYSEHLKRVAKKYQRTASNSKNALDSHLVILISNLGGILALPTGIFMITLNFFRIVPQIGHKNPYAFYPVSLSKRFYRVHKLSRCEKLSVLKLCICEYKLCLTEFSTKVQQRLAFQKKLYANTFRMNLDSVKKLLYELSALIII
jgi:hypothetical protein